MADLLETPDQARDAIEYLLWARFPNLVQILSNGPQAEIDAVRTYREELQMLPEEELAARFEQQRTKDKAEKRIAAEREEAGRFYNQTAAAADWTFWARQAFWTVDEAVALSLGKNPHAVTWEHVSQYTSVSSFARAFVEQRQTFHRAKLTGGLSERPRPMDVLDWAQSMGIQMPAPLLAEMDKLGMTTLCGVQAHLAEAQTALAASLQENVELQQRIAELEASAASREKPPRIVDEKMIYAMAKEKFRFDPDKRDGAATNIAHLCSKLGVEVSERAVRGRLSDIAEKQRSGKWER